jgi:DNA-cytosine methyltransferase
MVKAMKKQTSQSSTSSSTIGALRDGKSPAPSSRRTIRVPKVIKFGSDFSGIDAAATAMQRLFKDCPGKFKNCFASDLLPEAHKVVAHKPGPKPGRMFADVTTRSVEDEVGTDVYVWTPPCQAFSKAGRTQGLNDPRGSIMSVGVKYIVRHLPRVTIFENVKGMTVKKFRPILAGITNSLKAEYTVHWKLLSSDDFQVPQIRERLFMVAIRRDSLRHAFRWPKPVKPKIMLSDVLDPFIPKTDKPGRLPHKGQAKEFLKTACTDAHRNGTDPLTTPVAIDIDCSPAYQTVGINMARTLTRTRGGQGGPWISSRGRRTTPTELLKIQGFTGEDEVPWKDAGISAHKLGELLGNAVPVPMIGHVLSEAMYSAGVTASKVVFPPAADSAA